MSQAPIPKGVKPSPLVAGAEEYLFKKLEETRKDCQWLLGLGAASVFGIVIKDGFGAATPELRYLTLTVAMLQILTAMFGAMSKWEGDVNAAVVEDVLKKRLRTRYLIRNVAVFLLGTAFILVAWLGWLTPLKT